MFDFEVVSTGLGRSGLHGIQPIAAKLLQGLAGQYQLSGSTS